MLFNRRLSVPGRGETLLVIFFPLLLIFCSEIRDLALTPAAGVATKRPNTPPAAGRDAVAAGGAGIRGRQGAGTKSKTRAVRSAAEDGVIVERPATNSSFLGGSWSRRNRGSLATRRSEEDTTERKKKEEPAQIDNGSATSASESYERARHSQNSKYRMEKAKRRNAEDELCKCPTRKTLKLDEELSPALSNSTKAPPRADAVAPEENLTRGRTAVARRKAAPGVSGHADADSEAAAQREPGGSMPDTLSEEVAKHEPLKRSASTTAAAEAAKGETLVLQRAAGRLGGTTGSAAAATSKTTQQTAVEGKEMKRGAHNRRKRKNNSVLSYSQSKRQGKQKRERSLQQPSFVQMTHNGGRNLDDATEGSAQQQPDTIKRTVSPFGCGHNPKEDTLLACRDWRREGPHRWLLESPFLKESVTVPKQLEQTLRLLPFLFYRIDDEGDAIMYLKLSDIQVGPAHVLLSDEVLKAVFRFRFFVVFGWLAPASGARAKVFIDAREFSFTDALLQGGLPLTAAFVRSFASTMGQTPIIPHDNANKRESRLTNSSDSSYHVTSYDNAVDCDRGAREVNAICSHQSLPVGGSSDHKSKLRWKHSNRRWKSSTSGNRSSRNSGRSSSGRNPDGIDRLREAHVLEAPPGSAIFFRVAQAIVGLRLPLYFYSTTSEFASSTFALATGFELGDMIKVSHAQRSGATKSAKQQNDYQSTDHNNYKTSWSVYSTARDRKGLESNGGEENNTLSSALGQEARNISRMSGRAETFTLEKCFAEYVAYVRGTQTDNSRRAPKQMRLFS